MLHAERSSRILTTASALCKSLSCLSMECIFSSEEMNDSRAEHKHRIGGATSHTQKTGRSNENETRKKRKKKTTNTHTKKQTNRNNNPKKISAYAVVLTKNNIFNINFLINSVFIASWLRMYFLCLKIVTLPFFFSVYVQEKF